MIAKFIRYFIFSILLVVSTFHNVNGQVCDSITPSDTVDLQHDPNGVYISPQVRRDGFCCSFSGNVKCIEFVVLLHPDAEGVIFDIYSGAVPPGALNYQINCGPATPVGSPICLSGIGPHIITFCKPGNNLNEYRILSVAEPVVPESISVNDGCSKELGVTGFDVNTIQWTTITDTIGKYDSYLSCTSSCDTILVTPGLNYPDSIEIEVCGYPFGGCDSIYICDTVVVKFFSTLRVDINPEFPTICFGDTSVSIEAVPGGGSPPYTYSWSNGDSTRFTNVNTGTYIIELGDTSGCPPTYDTVTVTAFSLPIEANAGNDTLSCAENLPYQLSGLIQAASGGKWIGNGTFAPADTSLNAIYTPDSIEIANGVANLQLITTGNGTCPADTDLLQIDILKFNAAISTASIPVSCKGSSDGQGIIKATGSRIPYTYVWDANTGGQTTDTAFNLAAGNYSVTAIDSVGCILDTLVEVIEADSILAVVINTSPESCFDSSDGSVLLIVSGGALPYTIVWDASITTFTDTSANNLDPGTYSVSITDNFGCVIDTSFTITGPLAPLSIILSKVDVSCNNGVDGSASVIAIGGTAPYTYLWDDSTGFQITSTANNLKAGMYSVLVTDTMGCIATDSILLSEPLSNITFTDSTTSPSCFGFNDGTATVFPAGGTPPYTFLWDTLAGSQTTQTATGLSAGTYSCIIFDQNSCLLASPIIVIDPQPLFSTAVEIIHVSCKGGSDGSARVIASGGTGPYTYQWDSLAGFQTDSIATGLKAGIYSILVNDQNGCTFIPGIEILEPTDSLSLIMSSNPVLCKGDSTGFAFAQIIGGTSPYTIEWDTLTGFQSTDTAFNLPFGTYTISVTDSNGCQADSTVQVMEPPSILSAAISSIPAFCNGDSNGTAIVVPSGATPPYQIQWDANSGNQQNDTATNLPYGFYNVSILDANDCPLDTGILVSQPSPVISSGDKQDVLCYGESTGWAFVNAMGGTPPYSVLWDAGTGNQSSDTAKGLIAGLYSVMVTDSKGCNEDTNFILTQPDTFLLLSSGKLNVLCKGDSNGLAYVLATGGTSPYYYQWGSNANAQTTDTAFNLKAGTYAITVMDTFGCTDNLAITITEPNQFLSTNPVKIDLTCFNSDDGMAIANAGGGTAPYTYLWTQGLFTQNGDTAFNLTTGTVVLQVTDTNNCTLENDTLLIAQPDEVIISVSESDTICIGDSTQLIFSGSGGNGSPYTYRLLPFDTIVSPYYVKPNKSSIYGLRAIDNKGCLSQIDIVNVFVQDLLKDTLKVQSTGDICLGDTVGIFAYYNGKYPNYEIDWNTNEEGLQFIASPVNSRYYTLAISNDCAVTIKDSVFVDVFPLPELDLNELIAEGCVPLTVNFSNLANDPNISGYQWDFGDGNVSIDPTPINTYDESGRYDVHLTLTNSFGCESVNDSSFNHVMVYALPEVDFYSNPNLTDLRNPKVKFISKSSPGKHYWEFGDLGSSNERDPIYIYGDTGDYQVTLKVVDSNGCEDVITNRVIVNPWFKIEIPNAFTPNPNGGSGGIYDPNATNNYVFFPVTEGVSEFEMMIFNRWGELIFESKNYNIGWDGYFRGTMAQQEVYVWKLKIKWENGQDFEGIGDVTLFR